MLADDGRRRDVTVIGCVHKDLSNASCGQLVGSEGPALSKYLATTPHTRDIAPWCRWVTGIEEVIKHSGQLGYSSLQNYAWERTSVLVRSLAEWIKWSISKSFMPTDSDGLRRRSENEPLTRWWSCWLAVKSEAQKRLKRSISVRTFGTHPQLHRSISAAASVSHWRYSTSNTVSKFICSSLRRPAKMNSMSDETRLLDQDIEDRPCVTTGKATNSRMKTFLGVVIGISLLLSCWAVHAALSSPSGLEKSTNALQLAKRARDYVESVRVGGNLLMQLAGAGPRHPTSALTHDTLFTSGSGWNSVVATDQGIPALLLPLDSALRHFFDLDVHSDEESDRVTWEQNVPYMVSGRQCPVSQWCFQGVSCQF